MPNFDGTGPMGMGPMTGGGRGYCMGYVNQYNRFPFWGGRGRGYRHMYYATGLPGWLRGRYPYMPAAYAGAAGGELPDYPDYREREIAMLREQERYLENSLKDLKEYIRSLEKDIRDEREKDTK